MRNGASWPFPAAPWWLRTKKFPHWLVFTRPGLLPGPCPHPPSCGPVSLRSRWSSRWLLPSPWKEALDRQAGTPWTLDLTGGVGLEGKAGCCGWSEASPTSPAPLLGILSAGACSCRTLGLVDSIEEEAAEFRAFFPPGLGHHTAAPWAQPRPAPSGSLPVTPPSSGEMLSRG